MKTVLTKEQKPIVDEFFDFIKTLNEEEQGNLKLFLAGARAMKEMGKGKEPVKN